MICHRADLGQNLEGSIKMGRKLLIWPVREGVMAVWSKL